MTPQGLVGGYQLFSGRFWLKLKPFYRDGGMFYSKALVPAYQTALCCAREEHTVCICRSVKNQILNFRC